MGEMYICCICLAIVGLEYTRAGRKL